MATEKRLIDANELLEKHTCDVYGAYDDSCMVQAVFVPYIKGAPTVDAVEVVHGRWENNHCNVCGMTPIGEELWKYLGYEPPRFELCMDYCPNCGADMRERKDND